MRRDLTELMVVVAVNSAADAVVVTAFPSAGSDLAGDGV